MALSSKQEGILIKISADISQMQAGIVQVEKSIQNLGNAQSGLTKSTQQTTAVMKSARNAYYEAGAALFVYNQAIAALNPLFDGLIKVYTDVVKAGTDFQTMVANSATIVGANSEGIKILTAEMRRLLRTTAVSPDDLGAASYEILSAGITEATAVTKVLDASVKLSIAGIADLKSTVDAMTSTLNAYNYSADYAGRVSEIFFKAVEAGKLTFQEMASSISTVLPVASAMNIELEEITAQMAAMTQVGFSASDSFTYLRQLITGLQEPTEELKKRFRELNVTTAQQLINLYGLQGALLKIVENQAPERVAQFTTRIQANQAILTVTADGGRRVAKIYNAMGEGAEKLNAAYKVQAETLKNLTKNYDNLVFALREAIFNAGINDMLTEMTKRAAAVVDSLEKAVRANNDFAKGIAYTVVGLGIGAQHAQFLIDNLFKIGLIMANWQLLMKGILAITLNLLLPWRPLGALIRGIITLVSTLFLGIASNLLRFTNWFQTFFTSGAAAFAAANLWLALLLAGLAAVYAFWDKINPKVKGFVEAIKQAAYDMAVWTGLIDPAAEGMAKMADEMERYAEAAQSIDPEEAFVTLIALGKKEAGADYFENILKSSGGVFDVAAGQVESTIDALRNRAMGFEDIFSLGDMPQEVSDMIDRLYNAADILERHMTKVRNLNADAVTTMDSINASLKYQDSLYDPLVDAEKKRVELARIYLDRQQYILEVAKARNIPISEQIKLWEQNVGLAQQVTALENQSLEIERQKAHAKALATAQQILDQSMFTKEGELAQQTLDYIMRSTVEQARNNAELKLREGFDTRKNSWDQQQWAILRGLILDEKTLTAQMRLRVTVADQAALKLEEQRRAYAEMAQAQQEKRLAPVIAAEKARLDILEPMNERYDFQLEVMEAMDRPLREQLAITKQKLEIAKQQDKVTENQLQLQRISAEAQYREIIGELGIKDALDEQGRINYEILNTIAETDALTAKRVLNEQISAKLLADQSGHYEDVYSRVQSTAAAVVTVNETEKNRVTALERATLEYEKQRREMGFMVDLGDILANTLTQSVDELATGQAKVKDILKNFMEPVKAEFIKGFAKILKTKAGFDQKWEFNMTDTVAGGAQDAAQSATGSFANMFTSIGSWLSDAWTGFKEFFGFVQGGASGKVTVDASGTAAVAAANLPPGQAYSATASPMAAQQGVPPPAAGVGAMAMMSQMFGNAALGYMIGSMAGGLIGGGAADYGGMVGGLLAAGYTVGTMLGPAAAAGIAAALEAMSAMNASMMVAMEGSSAGGPVGLIIAAILAAVMITLQETSKKSAKQLAEKAYEKFFENATDWKIVKKTGTRIALLDTFNTLDLKTRELIEVFALLSTSVVEDGIGVRRAYGIALQQLLSGAVRANELDKEQGLQGLGSSLGIDSLEEAIDMWMERVNDLILSMDKGGIKRFTGDQTEITSGLEGFQILVDRGLIPSIERGIELLIDFYGEDLPQAIKNNVPEIIKNAFVTSLESLKRYFDFTPADVPGGEMYGDLLKIARDNAEAAAAASETDMSRALKDLNWILDKFVRKSDTEYETTGFRYTEESGFTRQLLKTVPDLLLLMKEFQAIVYRVDPESGKIESIDTAGGLDIRQFRDILIGETAEFFNFIADSFKQSAADILVAAGDAAGNVSDVFDQRVDEYIQAYINGAMTIDEVISELNKEFNLELEVSDLDVTGADIVRRLQIEQEALAAMAEGLAAGTEVWLNGGSFEDAMDKFADTLSAKMYETANEAMSKAFFQGMDMENILSGPMQNLETALTALFAEAKDYADNQEEGAPAFDFEGGLSEVMDQLSMDFSIVGANMESLQPIMEAYIEMQERMALAMTTFSQAARQAADYVDAIDIAIASFGENEQLAMLQQEAETAGERRAEAEKRVRDSYARLFPAGEGDLFSGQNLAVGMANIRFGDDENLKRIIKNLGAAAQAITEAAQAQIAVLEEQLRIAKEWQELVFKAEDSLRQVSGYGGDDQAQAVALLEQEQARAARLIEQYRTGTDAERLAAAQELVDLGPQLMQIAEQAGYDPGSSVFEAIRSTMESVLEEIIAEGKVKSESVEDLERQIRDIEAQAVLELQNIQTLLEFAESEAERRATEAAGNEPDWEYLTGPGGPLASTADSAEKTFKRLDEGINTYITGMYSIGDDEDKQQHKFDKLPEMQHGGIVTSQEMIARLHGPEAVIPLDRLPDLVAGIMPGGLGKNGGALAGIFEGLADVGMAQLSAMREVMGSFDRMMHLEETRLEGMREYLNVMQTIVESRDYGIEAIREDERRARGGYGAEEDERRVVVEFKNVIDAIITKDPTDPEEQQLIRAIAAAMPKVLQRPQVRRAIENAVKGMSA